MHLQVVTFSSTLITMTYFAIDTIPYLLLYITELFVTLMANCLPSIKLVITDHHIILVVSSCQRTPYL